MKEQHNRKTLSLFLGLNFIVWCIVPLLRRSLPMDTMEAIVWGKYSWVGTTKHPPFSGILAYLFFSLFQQHPISMYLLSQLCVVLGIVYIYKLALKLLASSEQALLTALLQFGVIYYDFSSVEFNVNVVSLALWPMCAYYFWTAYTENKWKNWLLFGVVAALNLLNKYVAGLELAAFATFVLFDKNIFKLMKNIKVYVAGLIGLAVLAPHLWWMYENNFEPLNYIASRSGSGKLTTVWRHLIYPLKFIGAQITFCAAGLVTYGCFYRKNKSVPVAKSQKIRSFLQKITTVFGALNGQERRKSLFILMTTLLPLGIFSFLSLMSGHSLKSMWGFPCLYMFGISLFYFFPLRWNESRKKHFIAAMFMWSMSFAVAYGTQCLLTTSNRYASDCPQIVKMLVQKWQEKVPHKPLKYVGATEWFANMVNLYAEQDIKPMVWLSPKNNPWLDKEDFESNGALLVAEDVGAYQKMGETYEISEPQKITLEYHNYFGKTKKKDLFYGFYLPKESIDGK